MLGVNEAIEEVIGLVGAELAKHQWLLLKELMSEPSHGVWRPRAIATSHLEPHCKWHRSHGTGD